MRVYVRIVRAYEYKLVCVERRVIPACVALGEVWLLSSKDLFDNKRQKQRKIKSWQSLGIEPRTLACHGPG